MGTGDIDKQQVLKQASPDSWPTADLEAVGQCPICGSPRRDLLHKSLQDRVFYCAPGSWDLFRCINCGSAYLDPRPTPDSIVRAYENYYTHGGNWRTPSQDLPPLRRVLRALSNGYFNYRFGTEFQPSLSIGALLAYLAPWARRRLDAVGRHLPKSNDKGRLLDVGCGNGMFLEFARSAGWETFGVDFDAAAVEVCISKGLNVLHGGIDQLGDKSSCFDWITLSHVVEHVHKPVELLITCRRLLKPGGILWISTPNIDSLGHREFGRHWRGLEPPRHLILFNRSSLKRALSDAGFKEIEDAPYQPLYRELAAKSQAISEGRDPYSVRPAKVPSIRWILADWHAWNDPEKREFVTLIARKTQ